MGVSAKASTDACCGICWHGVLLSLFILLPLVHSSHGARQTSTLNLACMRINTATSQLKEPGRGAALLEDNCIEELVEAMEGLMSSKTKVIDDPEDARRDLVGVESYLESCSKRLGTDRSLADAYVLLTKVSQSVASAENLIDQSVLISPEELKQDDEVDIQDPMFEIQRTDDDVTQSWISNLVLDQEGRQAEHLESFNLRHSIPQLVDMEKMVVDYCPNHVDLRRSSARICLDRACGGKFHTPAKYSSGIFTVRMRCPSGAPGVSNSFYISSTDGEADVISFDFVGNMPNRVLTSYAVNGDHSRKLRTFHLEFDTSLEFHDYTIKWDTESIVWMVDDMVIRRLRSSRVRDYPKKPGHIYGYSWDSSSVAEGKWAGQIDWKTSPFYMHYEDLQITWPLYPGQWRAPPRRQVRKGFTIPLRPLVIDYGPANIAIENDFSSAIAFDKFGCGGRIRSLNSYPSGHFSASIKCADGDTSGLLTSFYVSSGEGSPAQDEIDFEFLGDNKRVAQTNFYVNGAGGNELWIELDFDCSQAFHTYSILYGPQKIQWFVDHRLVRTVLREQQMQQQEPYPVKNVFLYSSMWNASGVSDGLWTGKWYGSAVPFVAKFKQITVQYPF